MEIKGTQLRYDLNRFQESCHHSHSLMGMKTITAH